MPSDAELYRTGISAFDFELRFYVGGQYALAAHDSLLVGATYSPTMETLLTNYVTPTSASLEVDDTTGFELGQVIICPLNENEEYEHVAWGDKDADEFLELTRGSMHMDDMNHVAGAAVVEWVDITNKVLNFTFDDTFSGNISRWVARLSGTDYNAKLLANDCAVLAMMRLKPASELDQDWTDWTIFFLGYIKDSTGTDDSKTTRAWEIAVESIAQYMGTTDISALSIGHADLAEGKSVTVSSSLEYPEQEVHPEEFVAGYPDLTGDQAIDGDLNTLWISADEPATTPDEPVDGWITINEVFPADPDDGVGPAWIELRFQGPDPDLRPLSLHGYAIVNHGTTFKTVSWQSDWPPVPQPPAPNPNPWLNHRVPNENYLQLPDIGIPPDGFVVFTEDAALFRQFHNVGTGSRVQVLDWRAFMPNGDFTMDWDSDFLCLWYVDAPESEVWINLAAHNYAGSDYNGPIDPLWSGDPLARPNPGRSLRREPAGNNTHDATGWTEEDVPTPGSRKTGEPEWLQVDLGNTAVVLTQDLLVGELVEADVDSTDCFEDGPAYVKVDLEVMQYASVDRLNNKLLTLTRPSPVGHSAGAPVKPYDNDLGLDMDMWLVSTIRMQRRRVLDANGMPIVPQKFLVYTSTLDSPINRDDEDWDDDWRNYWSLVIEVTNNATEYWLTSFEPRRARHVLIAIHDMSDGGRAKINTFSVLNAITTIDVGGVAQNGGEYVWTGDVCKFIVCSIFGLDESLFTLTDAGAPFRYIVTTMSPALSVVEDLCRRSGAVLQFHRDHSVEHMFNPSLPLAALPSVDITWERDNARSISHTTPAKHVVSQLTLVAEDTLEGVKFSVQYPPEALILGGTRREEDYIVGSEEDAMYMAYMLFYLANGPDTATIVPKGVGEWILPLQRHAINWDVCEDGMAINRINYVVTGVHLRVSFGTLLAWKTWDLQVDLQSIRF